VRHAPFQFSLATLVIGVLCVASLITLAIHWHPWHLVRNPLLSGGSEKDVAPTDDVLLAARPDEAPGEWRTEDGPEGSTVVLRVAPGAADVRLAGHRGYISSLRFSPQRERVVTASWDGTARVWDAASGASLAVLIGHEMRVNQAVFSPDGERVATAGCDGTARLWDARTGAPKAVLKGHEGQVLEVEYSPGGGMLLTRGSETEARLWDTWSGAPETDFCKNGRWGSRAGFSADGLRLVIEYGDGEKLSWRRVRPEPAWGVFVLPEFWLALAFGGWLAWRFRRHRRTRTAAAQGANHAAC
jgi:hypothetical protein